MSTSALIRFAKREQDVPFYEHPPNIQIQIFQHYNGRLEQLGKKLCKILIGKRVVSGFTAAYKKEFNGPGDLAASVLAMLKCWDGEVEGGNIYLEPPSDERGGINYIYYIWSDYNQMIMMSVFDHNDICRFQGTPEDLKRQVDIGSSSYIEY